MLEPQMSISASPKWINPTLRAISFGLALLLVTLNWSLLATIGPHITGRSYALLIMGAIICGVSLMAAFFFATRGTQKAKRLTTLIILMMLFIGGGDWLGADMMLGLPRLVKDFGPAIPLFCGPIQAFGVCSFGLASGVYLFEL